MCFYLLGIFEMRQLKLQLWTITIVSSLSLTGTGFAQENRAAPQLETDPLTSAAPDNIGSRVFDGVKNVRDVSSAKSSILSLAASESVSVAQSLLSGYFPTAEVSLKLQDGNKPEGGILILKPLSPADVIDRTVFTQGSVHLKDGRTTVNIGIGYRRLERDDTLLVGVNAFYDHEFPYRHGRSSVGFEARTTVGELNANIYNSHTNWHSAETGFEEKALSGADIELGLPLPYLNWSKIYVRSFNWRSVLEGVPDIRGRDISLRADMPGQLLKGIAIEAGHRNFDNERNEKFLTMSYDIGRALSRVAGAQKQWVSKSAFVLGSMEDQRFEKVRRENHIVKQTRASGSITIGGV